MIKLFTISSRYALIKAIEDSFFRAWAIFGRIPDAFLYNTSEDLWFSTSIHDSMLNAVLNSHTNNDKVNSKVKLLTNHFQLKCLPMSWYIGPSSFPVNLQKQLEQFGFLYADSFIGMAINLLELNINSERSASLKIARVDNGDLLTDWVNVFREGFGVSEDFAEAVRYICANFDFSFNMINYHYLGFLDGQPVASVTLSLSDGIASIYDVATIPIARGQGIGSALTSHALLEARRMGYYIGVLQSSEIGRKIYQRLGFQEFCAFHRYVYGLDFQD